MTDVFFSLPLYCANSENARSIDDGLLQEIQMQRFNKFGISPSSFFFPIANRFFFFNLFFYRINKNGPTCPPQIRSVAGDERKRHPTPSFAGCLQAIGRCLEVGLKEKIKDALKKKRNQRIILLFGKKKGNQEVLPQ